LLYICVSKNKIVYLHKINNMNCRIIYKDNKIDHVQAENGERSILFDSLKDIFGAEKALELYALTEEDGYKQKIQEKVRSFVGVTEKQVDKLSEVIEQPNEVIIKTQEYLTRINNIKEQDPDNYWSVDIPSIDVVRDAVQNDRLVEVEGGMGIVTQDGNMIGLFKDNSNAKNVAKELQQMRVEKGGIKMDNFDGYLTKIYQKNGFRVVSRLPFDEDFSEDLQGWSKEKHGTPDVVFMIYDPQNRLNIEEKTFSKGQYNDALSYRESFIEEAKTFHPFYSKKLADNKTGKTQAFFSDVVEGKSDKYKAKKEWTPLLTYTKVEEAFNKVYSKFKGNFDNHIATSIPTFRETQVKVGSALVEILPDNSLVYDIGGSEGGFVKAITEVSGGKIKSINLDVNESMQKSHENSPVEGSVFVNEAFYESYTDEDTGKTYNKHIPNEKADVVHESMVFQFITPERKSFIKEVKDSYLKNDGILLLEEKLVPLTDEQWLSNENKKDAYKLNFYTQEEISGKAEEVLLGMRQNQTQEEDLINALKEEFNFVQEYWDAGNFKGYIATNSEAKGIEFLEKLGGKITSEYSEKAVDKEGVSYIKKPSLKIEVKEVNGRLVVEPLVNGNKAGALRMLPYEDGYRVDSVTVYDKYQNKRLGTRLYQEAIKFLLKSQTPLYSLKVRSENAKKIWDKFVEIGVAQKVGEDYIAPNKAGLDKNNEASPSDVMQYANTTDEKLSKEETTEAIDLAVSLGVETSEEAVAILKDAFLENNAFVFDKKKMKKAGYNDYEITKILTDVNLQNQIKNNLAKLENTDFSAPLMDVQTSPEIGIFGKQKVKPKVKTVNVKTVNEQGEVVDKVSDTKELLRKTYPDTLPEDMPQIAVSLLKASENIVNNYNDLFYSTLEDLKDASLDLGVDLKDIENRVFPLENFKSFVNSLMNYYVNPSDAFAEVYDEFFENYGAEKATKPTMSTPYTEYELFDKFNLVRNGDEYIKVEDVEIEPSAERQAKIPQLEVEDFAVDFDKLEKLVYHKEQLGAEMKTLQKPLVEEINLREVKKNPYLKATSEGVKLVSEDPLTAQKAELYGYEPKVAEKQPKKIETDYSLVQDVLVTQLTPENKVRTPKGNFTKFMDDNNKSVFLLDGSKQKTVDLEGYLSKADNMPKIEAKKLYSKEEYENNFGCLN
jgi:hypothetical protein